MSIFEPVFQGRLWYIHKYSGLAVANEKIERRDAEMQRLSYILTTLDSASLRLPG